MSDNLIVSLANSSWVAMLAGLAGIGIAVWMLANYRLVYIIIRTLPRDLTALVRLIKILVHLKYLQRRNYSVSDAFNEIVKKNPKKVILYFEDQEWTAEQVQKFSNQVANYFQQKGLSGKVVAIYSENSIHYLSLWLGLSKIGCTASLINYNLRLQPLRHCFEAVESKAIIYSPSLTPALNEVIEMGGIAGIPLFCIGNEGELNNNAIDLLKLLPTVSDKEPIVSEKIGFTNNLFYIFTSGTTGLPKAAVIRHSRFFFAAVANFYIHKILDDDRIYTALPLYHGSAVMMGGGAALCHGVAMVIRKKFSASQFWIDCNKYNCTVAQYIGEICRYLMNQPPSKMDQNHKVRLIFGNGLRADLWEEFQKRFNIPQIHELYGSTEGNCNMVNISNRVGAVGFAPRHLSWIIPIRLIKVDEETGQPIRNKDGFAIQVKRGQSGELIGRIQKNHPIRDYDGYADKSSSKDKVMENAFTKGDRWFRSGDILVMDEFGFFYFKDRSGDTFRWKGENCSTAECEAVISTVCALQDVAVFGVEIPGAEGRAGMAVIADENGSLDIEALAVGVIKMLPSYARPLFIRVVKKINMTGTYKLQKADYKKQGYDVTKIPDKIYFLKGSKYVDLDQTLYEDIVSGKLRL